MSNFNGLGMNLGNLARLSKAQTCSISPENFTGEKGQGGMATGGTGATCARDLGRGWKVSPSVKIEAGKTFELADIPGPGAIQQIWMTPTGNWRFSILRIYWDDQARPSVECPLGDFFASGWGEYAQLTSLAVCVNPGSAFNCYWEMPFRKRCRMTVTNLADDAMILYYQINYTLTEVPDDLGYFHAQFRRANPLPYKTDYTILDGVRGLEEVANTHAGVRETYALQAGREIRIFVHPEEIDDLASIQLARDISKQIEETMQYPGQIKVTVIRETRATDYAK